MAVKTRDRRYWEEALIEATSLVSIPFARLICLIRPVHHRARRTRLSLRLVLLVPSYTKDGYYMAAVHLHIHSHDLLRYISVLWNVSTTPTDVPKTATLSRP